MQSGNIGIHSLPSSQIHKVDDGGFCHELSCLVLCLLDEGDSYDSVGAATGGIHVGGGDGPVFGALGNPVFYVLVVFYRYRTQLLHCRNKTSSLAHSSSIIGTP